MAYDWVDNFCIEEDGVIYTRERSSDPNVPPDGVAALWKGDGTGTGSDGDIFIKGNVGGTLSTTCLHQSRVTGTTVYPVVCEGRSFTEAGDTTYTGTVEIPAGAILLNIQFVTTVLWDDGTSASLDIGDDDDPNGWFASVSVKATDLAVGEVLDITNAENWGAKQGVYLVAATGRKGRTTAGVDSGIYYGAASEVIGVITTGAQDGSAGRSFMAVTYMMPNMVAATAA